jgi:predicted HTH transcriptional regulator
LLPLVRAGASDCLGHAAVAVTRKGKGRTILRGNLICQQRELIALLDSVELNPPLKIKGKRAYEERAAYPSRTLMELIVNLLVHRNYEAEELAEIDVESGRAVQFNNPGLVRDPRALANRCTGFF